MSKQPNWHHQSACLQLCVELVLWNRQSGLGCVNAAPGVIFAEDDDVAPDAIWISNARLASALDEDGKLHAAPELVIEVLSPGSKNERRDRQAKLKLYSRRDVDEYWILNWRLKQVEVYRRENDLLKLVSTLYESDTLDSPLLPGFACRVAAVFS